jgi:hypothetical protein
MKITIEKFQELHQISMIETDEMEKSSMLVQCLTNFSFEKVNQMSIKSYNKLCKKINEAFNKFTNNIDNKKPRNIVRVNGKFYFLNYDIAKPPMNAGRYVEIATFSNDIIGNLHKIMATMCTPMKWSWRGLKLVEGDIDHERVSDDMLKMDFSVAYHSAVFFYAVFTKSIQNSHTYFKSITEDKMKLEEVMQNLHEVMDGSITARWYQNLKISV